MPLREAHTADLSPQFLGALRTMLDAAFAGDFAGDFAGEDRAQSLGGTRAWIHAPRRRVRTGDVW